MKSLLSVQRPQRRNTASTKERRRKGRSIAQSLASSQRTIRAKKSPFRFLGDMAAPTKKEKLSRRFLNEIPPLALYKNNVLPAKNDMKGQKQPSALSPLFFRIGGREQRPDTSRFEWPWWLRAMFSRGLSLNSPLLSAKSVHAFEPYALAPPVLASDIYSPFILLLLLKLQPAGETLQPCPLIATEVAFFLQARSIRYL